MALSNASKKNLGLKMRNSIPRLRFDIFCIAIGDYIVIWFRD